MKKRKMIIMLLALFVCTATLTGYGTYSSEAATPSATTKAKRPTITASETSETDTETVPENDTESASVNHTESTSVEGTESASVNDAESVPASDIEISPADSTESVSAIPSQPSDKSIINIKVTDTVTYSPQTGCPDIPDTHIITYYNEVTKQEEQIEGVLIDCVQSEEKEWLGGYDIKGIFTTPAGDTTEWVLEGIGNISLSQNAESPSWDNYQSDILAYLGLEDTEYRITGAFWDGEAYYDESGLLCRKAVYCGEALVTGYTATYEGTGQAYAQ